MNSFQFMDVRFFSKQIQLLLNEFKLKSLIY